MLEIYSRFLALCDEDAIVGRAFIAQFKILLVIRETVFLMHPRNQIGGLSGGLVCNGWAPTSDIH